MFSLWNLFKPDSEFKVSNIRALYTGAGGIWPNSFCLHLIMMTSDKKVILTRVSNNKRNDYPQRWAVTIGEQIECSDVEDKVFIHDDFLTTWTERAIREEFGIGDYDRIVNNNSIRALAFDFEGDIYNIALVTIVSLRETCNDLLNDMKMMPFSEREFADIVPLELDLIPVILSRYGQLEKQLHPSSFLRLYLCYIHYYGVDSFVRNYNKAKKLGKDSPVLKKLEFLYGRGY